MEKHFHHIFYKVVVRGNTSSQTFNLPVDKLDFLNNKLCKISVEQIIVKQLQLTDASGEEVVNFNISFIQPYSFNSLTNGSNQLLFMVCPFNDVTSDYVNLASGNSHNGIICLVSNSFTITLTDKDGELIDNSVYDSYYLNLRITPLVE